VSPAVQRQLVSTGGHELQRVSAGASVVVHRLPVMDMARRKE